MIVDCAVYEDGKRRDGSAGPGATPTRAATSNGRLRLDRPARARRGGVRVARARVRPPPAGGGGRDQRPPAAEARGLRRHALHGAEDRALRRPDRGRRVRRDPRVPRARTSSSPSATARPATCTGCASALEGDPELLQPGPGRRRCTRSSTGWSTTTSPRSRASRTTSRRSRSEVFSPDRANPRRAHLPASSARCSSSCRATAPLVEPVDRLARGPLRACPPRDPHLLPRRERPPDPRPRPARGLPRPAHERARGQPDPGHACARTRTCARSRPGSRSSPCPP